MTRSLGNAWSNVWGRRVASITTVLVVASLMAAIVALLIPLRDVKQNVASVYDRSAWRSVYLVEGIDGASKPMGPTEVSALASQPSVQSATPFRLIEGRASDSRTVQVRNYVTSLEPQIVEGRLPASGACEGVVTRELGSVVLGQSMLIQVGAEGSSAGGAIAPKIVGIIDQSFPLINGPSMLTTCALPRSATADQVLVSTRGSALPPQYIAQTLNAVAIGAISNSSSTGLIGLLALVISVLSLVVVAAVARWGAKSRVAELAILRVWGRSRSEILRMIAIEQGILMLVAAPIGLGLGTLLAWRLVRAGGPASMIDPQGGLEFALPSVATASLALVGLGLTLVAFTLLPVSTSIRVDVARMLRRRGE